MASISDKGVFIGIATGAVGIWLTVMFYQNQQSDYKSTKAEHLCETARFNLSFSRRTHDDQDVIAGYTADVKRYCEQRDVAEKADSDQTAENKQDLDALKSAAKGAVQNDHSTDELQKAVKDLVK
jgi:hypothetical protein